MAIKVGGTLGSLADRAGGAGVGSTIGSVVAGPVGAVAGGYLGGSSGLGGLGGSIAGMIGQDYSKQNAANAQGQQLSKEQLEKVKKLNSAMNKSESKNLKDTKVLDKDYKGERNEAIAPYLAQLGQLSEQASKQANDASVAYSNDINPKLKNIMEDAQKNASSAMTLEEAGDPNNKIATAVRALYDKEAVSEGNRGKADYGILSALGAQATAGQLGGMPAFTGSNMQLLNANNQSQASTAYANAQRRMAALRDQGLDRGFSESANQYDRGVGAKNFFVDSISNYENAMDNDINRQQGLRDVLQGYGADTMGINRGVAAEDYQIGQGYLDKSLAYDGNDLSRKLAAEGDYYGSQQQGISNQIATANAQNQGKQSIFNSIIGAGATVGGAAAGAKR